MHKTVTIDVYVPAKILERMKPLMERKGVIGFGDLVLGAIAEDFARWGIGNHCHIGSATEENCTVKGVSYRKVSLNFEKETAAFVQIIKNTNAGEVWVRDLVDVHMRELEHRPDRRQSVLELYRPAN